MLRASRMSRWKTSDGRESGYNYAAAVAVPAHFSAADHSGGDHASLLSVYQGHRSFTGEPGDDGSNRCTDTRDGRRRVAFDYGPLDYGERFVCDWERSAAAQRFETAAYESTGSRVSASDDVSASGGAAYDLRDGGCGCSHRDSGFLDDEESWGDVSDMASDSVGGGALCCWPGVGIRIRRIATTGCCRDRNVGMRWYYCAGDAE
ncbi:TPA: hypothetical protein EYO57_27490 [Candidatus Poribacteria bacterium]|nr:hypothetical protein [Candidatus Poribacteria bacterium]